MKKRIRIIPALLLMHGGLYKTRQFKQPAYVGDPINTVKIFNEKGADEIVLLDIAATKEKKGPDYKKIAEIAGEAFMPMAYGGGIHNFEDAQRVFDAGFEKIILNSAAWKSPELISKVANVYGSQSAVVSIDAKTNIFGKYNVYTNSGTLNTHATPEAFARRAEEAGAGELFVNSIRRDGTWEGYDLPLIKAVSSAVSIPVIACGGASGMEDFTEAVTTGGASAVAAGSMFVYQRKGLGVLISFPGAALKL